MRNAKKVKLQQRLEIKTKKKKNNADSVKKNKIFSRQECNVLWTHQFSYEVPQ